MGRGRKGGGPLTGDGGPGRGNEVASTLNLLRGGCDRGAAGSWLDPQGIARVARVSFLYAHRRVKEDNKGSLLSISFLECYHARLSEQKSVITQASFTGVPTSELFFFKSFTLRPE